MDEREQQRKVRHRLAMLRHAEEVSGNVAATCRYYGISRQCFYKWKRRYDELGEAGLRDGSSAPLNSPNATKAEVVRKIIYLRSNYHFVNTRDPVPVPGAASDCTSQALSPRGLARTSRHGRTPHTRSRHRLMYRTRCSCLRSPLR